jgi:hypothetical protein
MLPIAVTVVPGGKMQLVPLLPMPLLLLILKFGPTPVADCAGTLWATGIAIGIGTKAAKSDGVSVFVLVAEALMV